MTRLLAERTYHNTHDGTRPPPPEYPDSRRCAATFIVTVTSGLAEKLEVKYDINNNFHKVEEIMVVYEIYY